MLLTVVIGWVRICKQLYNITHLTHLNFWIVVIVIVSFLKSINFVTEFCLHMMYNVFRKVNNNNFFLEASVIKEKLCEI